jgi:hypothetical protein
MYLFLFLCLYVCLYGMCCVILMKKAVEAAEQSAET